MNLPDRPKSEVGTGRKAPLESPKHPTWRKPLTNGRALWTGPRSFGGNAVLTGISGATGRFTGLWRPWGAVSVRRIMCPGAWPTEGKIMTDGASAATPYGP